MTWTWSETDLSTALAQVRLTVGDTNSSDPIFADEIIAYRLSLYSSDVRLASIKLLKDAIAKYARDTDRNQDGMSTSRSQKIQHWKDLLSELEGEGSAIVGVYVGGVSDAANETIDDDDDFIAPAFTVGKHDNT